MGIIEINDPAGKGPRRDIPMDIRVLIRIDAKCAPLYEMVDDLLKKNLDPCPNLGPRFSVTKDTSKFISAKPYYLMYGNQVVDSNRGYLVNMFFDDVPRIQVKWHEDAKIYEDMFGKWERHASEKTW